MQKEKPCLYGVGLGPGDPELITIKAKRLMEEAEVIFAPSVLKNGDSFAQRIACGLDEDLGGKIKTLHFPMTDDAVKLTASWQKAASDVLSELKTGKKCVFIVEGEPLLYGTFIYLKEKLEEGGECLVKSVPGIPAFSAGAASIGAPITKSGENMVLLPALKTSKEKMINTLNNYDTVFFYKVKGAISKLISALKETRRLEDAFLIENASDKDKEKVKSLEGLTENDSLYFSLVIVRRKNG